MRQDPGSRRPVRRIDSIPALIGTCLVGLALATPPVYAELRGKVHMVVNPDAPRADWHRIPLPGAYVAVFWSIVVPAPAHAVDTCPFAELARTDEHGAYRMRGPNLVTAGLAKPSFLVYSPGMETIDFPYGGSPPSVRDITMARSSLPAEERLSRLAGYTDPHCSDRKINDPHGLLGAYHHALLEEARRLRVESPRGLSQIQHLEAAARRTSGLDTPGTGRTVILPSPPIRSDSPPPAK